MSDDLSLEQPTRPTDRNRVAIVAIVAAAIVILAVLCACTALGLAFLTNAPWNVY